MCTAPPWCPPHRHWLDSNMPSCCHPTLPPCSPAARINLLRCRPDLTTPLPKALHLAPSKSQSPPNRVQSYLPPQTPVFPLVHGLPLWCFCSSLNRPCPSHLHCLKPLPPDSHMTTSSFSPGISSTMTFSGCPCLVTPHRIATFCPTVSAAPTSHGPHLSPRTALYMFVYLLSVCAIRM